MKANVTDPNKEEEDIVAHSKIILLVTHKMSPSMLSSLIHLFDKPLAPPVRGQEVLHHKSF
jgi:hypothetical protein